MITVQSNGSKEEVKWQEGMTVAQALQASGMRKGWRNKLHVGDAVVEPGHVVQDGDTITLAPAIKNG